MTWRSEQQSTVIFRLSCALLIVLALGVRIMAAAGDLTQDEITSVNAVATLQHWWDVFWTIDGDNTHYLTSLYLYFVGPDAGAFTRRIPSILEGTLTVVAAGVWGCRRGSATTLCTMAVFALSPMLVDYSSVARGYAGLGLFTVLLLIETEYALDHGLKPRLRLAVYALLGFLSHLLMAFAVAGAAIWVMIQASRSRPPSKVITATIRVFWLSAVAVLPLAALVTWHMLTRRYLMGETITFSTVKLIAAFSLAYQVAASLPFRIGNDYLSGTVTAVAVALGQLWLRAADPRARLYLVMVLIVPLLLAATHMQNISFARYVFPCMTVYLLMLGDIAGAAIATSGISRWLTVCALLSVLAGDTFALRNLLYIGRGDYRAALARMVAAGPVRYGVVEPSAVKILVYGANEYSLPARYVRREDWCAEQPDWLVDVTVSDDRAQAEHDIVMGPDACQMHFILDSIYPFAALTGVQYNLYRRAVSR